MIDDIKSLATKFNTGVLECLSRKERNMMNQLMEMKSMYPKNSRDLQYGIAKARSDLTDRYDPNLPGPARSAARRIEIQMSSNSESVIRPGNFDAVHAGPD